VKQPHVPYGICEGVKHLFGILQNQKNGDIIVEKARLDRSYWDIFFAEVHEGTYTFYLLGFPGGVLGTVADVHILKPYAVGISQPPPRDKNLTACFTAAGYASPGGTPSGTVTQVSNGKVYHGTNPTSGGMTWGLRFNVNPVPVMTSLFNQHVDVSNGSGSCDNNGLGIPSPCP
jgi:hypothetical protein